MTPTNLLVGVSFALPFNLIKKDKGNHEFVAFLGA